ncbi:MAG: lipase [Veillonella sp.]|nr:lipase [Veillonella sp.]
MGIICFGDSITRGYDVPYGRGWVEICDASIEGVNFTNYGEDGCSVQGMIYNIENWAVTAVSDPTRHIFLMCGTNDILQGRDSAYAEAHNIKVIDFYTTLFEADQIGQIVFAGEVHPNERGYRLMAYKALEVFTRL